MMNLLITGIFYVFVFLIGIMPFRLLYMFSDLIRITFQYVVRYRGKVIHSNLERCFPGMKPDEKKALIRKIYKNLADVTVEGVKSFSMTPRQVKKRHRIMNPESVEPYISKGKSIIAVTAHFNNWEWGSLSPGVFVKHSVFALYKPLSNPYIDRFILRSRSKFGTSLISIYKTGRFFERINDKPSIVVMAADQSPSNIAKSYWVDFLGVDTAFLHGPEKYARMYDLPVFYADIQRVKRGHYELTLSLLVESAASLPDGEVTRRYAARLEEAILKETGSWLWSHRRWKLSR